MCCVSFEVRYIIKKCVNCLFYDRYSCKINRMLLNINECEEVTFSRYHSLTMIFPEHLDSVVNKCNTRWGPLSFIVLWYGDLSMIMQGLNMIQFNISCLDFLQQKNVVPINNPYDTLKYVDKPTFMNMQNYKWLTTVSTTSIIFFPQI